MKDQKSIQEIALLWLSTRSERDFTSLYNRMFPGLQKYANMILKDYEAVHECVQQTFCNIITEVEKYDETLGQFSTWAYKICFNFCMMYQRRIRKTVTVDFEAPIGEDGINIFSPLRYAELCNDINNSDIQQHVHIDKEEVTKLDFIRENYMKLPPFYRDIFSDAILLGMSYDDVAKKYNIPLNTVKSRIHNAKKTLRQAFESGIDLEEKEPYKRGTKPRSWYSNMEPVSQNKRGKNKPKIKLIEVLERRADEVFEK